MKKLKTFPKIKLQGKTVLVRVDFNVPITKGKIQDDTRIRESLPTIKELIKQKAKIIIISHLGRPEGKKSKDLSLQPVITKLKKLVKTKVKFIDDCIGSKVETAVSQLKEKEILLLENCRFYAEEEKNDLKFAKKIAKLADIFINDAFSAAHRKHATTYGLAKLLPSYAGISMQKEIESLAKIFQKAKKPVTLVIGGAKIDTKIGLIKNFIQRADYFIIGGALANTFLRAEGYNIGESLCEENRISIAQEAILLIEKAKKKLLLPYDVIVADTISPKAKTLDLPIDDVIGDMKILDIGIKSALKFAQIIEKSQTIIWNGPLGLSEYKPFQKGTKTIAEAIIKATKKGSTSIIGGGDTNDALKRLKFKFEKFSHVSTAGGAMLEYLEGKKLPGIEILMK